MITSNALASDMSLPPTAAIDPESAPAPTSRNDDAQPGQSFAKLMGDTMGGQGQPPGTSAAPSTKPVKSDGKVKDKNSEKTGDSSILPTMAMTTPIPLSPAPIPLSPLPTTGKTPTSEGKACATVSVPSLPAQDPNIAANAKIAVNPKTDINTAVVAASVVSVPSGSQVVPALVSKPVAKDAPEIKTPSPEVNKSIGDMSSKSSSVDRYGDEPSGHNESHPQSQTSDLAPPPVPIPVPTTTGTGTAKQVVAMKPEEKGEGNTRTAEKNVPRGSFLPDNARSSAVEASPRGAVVAEARAAQGSAASSAPVSALGGVVRDNTEAVETQTRVGTVRSPQVDKVLTEVSDSAVSFKRIGAESVDVNLQPDRGTEISLHLTLSNGQVEMAARLERGNFDSLNTHWSDLQQSLAQQGIRVGELEHPSLNQSPEGNQNRNQAAFAQTMQQESGGQHRSSSGHAPEAADEPARTGTSVATPRARSSRATNSAPRGWEMWA